MRKIRLLIEAEAELSAIVNYVRDTHGKQTAFRVYTDIIERIAPLSTMPELGTLDTTLHYQGKPVRILHSSHTRIIYAIRETEIIILLFWDNRQDDSKLKGILSTR